MKYPSSSLSMNALITKGADALVLAVRAPAMREIRTRSLGCADAVVVGAKVVVGAQHPLRNVKRPSSSQSLI